MTISREISKIAKRIGRSLAVLFKGEATCRIEGILVPLDSRVLPDNVIASLIGGSYEKKEIEALRRLLANDDCVLELGAGIGVVSTAAALAARGGKVVCVEANPSLLPFIRQVHRKNGVEVEIVNAVVTRSGETESSFYVRENVWSSSLEASPSFSHAIRIGAVRLADLLARYSPTVLIADIEGAEVCLMDVTDLGTVRTIILEVHPHIIGDACIQDICRHLEHCGFTLELKGKMLMGRLAADPGRPAAPSRVQ